MARLLFLSKYTIPATLLTTIFLLLFFRTDHLILRNIMALSYLLFFGYFGGQALLPKETRGWQTLFGVVGMLCASMIILTPIYLLFSFSQTIVAWLVVLIPFAIGCTREKEVDIWEDLRSTLDFSSYVQTASFLGTKLLSLIFLWGAAVAFVVLLGKRYTDTLISPWTIVSPRFFLFFLLLTALLFFILQRSRDGSTNLLLLMAWNGIFFTVALIVYRFGFGFDQIIHQTAERYIDVHGILTPKTPYYIGQYMLTLFLHTLTYVPIETIDKSLVPIGASILVPLSLYFGFSRRTFQTLLIPAIAFVPFSLLTFFIVTTPNNFALLLSLVTIAWMWKERDDSGIRTHMLGFLLVGATLSIHPFIGAPLAVIYIGSLVIPQIKETGLRVTALTAYAVILTATLPTLFIVNGVRSGDIITLINPFNRLTAFFSLFSAPYWYLMQEAPLLWRLLYLYKLAIIPLSLALAFIGALYAIKIYRERLAGFTLISAAALLASAFWLATGMKFPNVISYEQQAYATRVLEFTRLLLVPFFLIAVREFFLLVHKKKVLEWLAALFVALLLTVSWYFTYPTRDAVSRFTGYNIRQADIDAVHFIADNNPAMDYIVLTNQVVAVTAFRELGFAKYLPTIGGEQFFYSVPTGGPLYQFFRKMVYEEPKREWMEQAMRYAGVKKAYFVHTNYWAPAGEIRDKAKLTADRWWDIGQGRVWIFEYTMK